MCGRKGVEQDRCRAGMGVIRVGKDDAVESVDAFFFERPADFAGVKIRTGIDEVARAPRCFQVGTLAGGDVIDFEIGVLFFEVEVRHPARD